MREIVQEQRLKCVCVWGGGGGGNNYGIKGEGGSCVLC